MKFVANSMELQRTLAKVGGVIPSKSTMPILENILFELAGNTLTLTGTDLVISLTASQSVSGSADGRIAIPAKRLIDTVRSLPVTEPNVSFAIDPATNKVKITTDKGQYVLTGENATEFPQVASFKPVGEFTLDNTVLRSIIYRTAFAVSTDELRPAMMGVLLQAKGEELRAVSTDGHRLVRLIHRTEKPTGLPKDIIIPAKALNIIAKSVEGDESHISMNESHIKFSFGQSVLVSRLIDETYPNYESVIPSDNTKVVTINRDETIASIRRVALYASATTHQVKFDVAPGTLTISAQDIDFGGEAKETIACSYAAERLEIGFNSVYLVDILSHLESEEVTMLFSTPTRAGIVSPVGKAKDDDVLMLVMPVRLNN